MSRSRRTTTIPCLPLGRWAGDLSFIVLPLIRRYYYRVKPGNVLRLNFVMGGTRLVSFLLLNSFLFRFEQSKEVKLECFLVPKFLLSHPPSPGLRLIGVEWLPGTSPQTSRVSIHDYQYLEISINYSPFILLITITILGIFRFLSRRCSGSTCSTPIVCNEHSWPSGP